MPRPMEHGDLIAFRASRAVRQTLETAAASLGTTKSQLVRAIVLQALRHEMRNPDALLGRGEAEARGRAERLPPRSA